MSEADNQRLALIGGLSQSDERQSLIAPSRHDDCSRQCPLGGKSGGSEAPADDQLVISALIMLTVVLIC
jgi:hypothetical protein